MTDASKLQHEVDARLRELEPFVEEYERLSRVAAAFRGESAAPRSPARTRRGQGTPSRRQGGGRTEQILALVTANPGITVAEIAERLGIGTTYLYRLLPRLEREGRVVKRGQAYHLAD